jgi:DHA1 family tetracycline resistance protein-like MFS transporter
VGGWVGLLGLRAPFFAAAAMTLAGAVYGLLVLPESLPRERRAPFVWTKASPLGSFALLRSHPELFGLSGVNFLMQLAHNILPTLFVLYASNRYGWSPAFTGTSMALIGACNVIVQSFLVGPVVARIGERGAVIAGLASGGLGFAIYGLAPTGWSFLLGIPVFAFIGLFGPGYNALVSRRVSPSEQGRLRGANASIDSTAGIIGPALFSLTYAWFVGGHGVVMPGAAFLLAAGLHALAVLLALAVARSATAAATSGAA